jgi:sugar-specific transcriptional regulator TrmB
MSTRDHIKILTDLGLKTYEAKLYLACVKLGVAPVARISETSGVARSYCYEAIQSLVDQGLISPLKGSGTQQYAALPVDRLFRLQSERLQRFEHTLPELRTLQNATVSRPHVLQFQGEHAIDEVIGDILSSLPARSSLELLSAQTESALRQRFFEPSFHAERIKKGISMRELSNDPLTKGSFPEQLLERAFLPLIRWPIQATVVLYDTRVAYLSEVGDTLAVQLESGAAAATQRTLFNLAWEKATLG